MVTGARSPGDWLAAGMLRARLLHIGVLAHFLYVHGRLAVGAAYNVFLLACVALFGTSLFASILAFNGVDRSALGGQLDCGTRGALLESSCC